MDGFSLGIMLGILGAWALLSAFRVPVSRR